MANVLLLHLFEKKRTYTYIDNKVKMSMMLKVTVLSFWVSKMKKTIFRNHSCTFWCVQNCSYWHSRLSIYFYRQPYLYGSSGDNYNVD